MKKLILGLFAIAPTVVMAQNSPHFAMRPSLTPDAQQIYFEYDTDIWRVATNGGEASRITALEGYESSALVSPDGKWLAFASNQNGNNDVYIVPTSGGEIKRLTFNDASDVPTSWSANSQTINFESNRLNNVSSYSVSINGGTPKRIFGNYFNTIANLHEMADGSYLFNESTESYRYATRKGYKGDHNPNIKKWNLKTNTYTELTSNIGKDLWATSDKNGKIYFVSDEANGWESNLATIENGKTKILTKFNNSVMYPKVSFNGEKVVFNRDYKIYVYDTKTQKSIVPEIDITVANTTNIENKYSVKGKINNYSISPDGKKIAFTSRGRLFVSDKDGKIIKELNTDKKERCVSTVWAADNKTIYFTRTRNGFYNLFSIDASSTTPEKAIYTPDEYVKHLIINNAKNKLVFTTGGNRIEMFDGKKVSLVTDKAEFWTFRTYNFSFSNDDNYLVFSSVNFFESDVYIYDFATKKLINVTESTAGEYSPILSSNNKYLYITANRYGASFPRGVGRGNSNLYRIPLNKYDTDFEDEKYDNMFEGEKKDTVKHKIDFNRKNIHRRWERMAASNAGGLYGVNVKGNDYLIYASSHEGSRAMYILKADGKSKPTKIKGSNYLSAIKTNGKDVYAQNRGSIYKLNISNATATKLNIDFEFTQNNRNEFTQMVYETWAQMESNFYDVKMHGVDWNSKLTYYAEKSKYVQNRNDLRILLNDMLNELNSSHLGFNSRGIEEKSSTTLYTAHTGIMFNNSNPYEVEYILEGSPADKESIDVRKGDKLVAINHKNIDTKQNRDKYFTSAKQIKEMTLTFERLGKTFDVNVHTTNATQIKNLLYFEWEDTCRERVDNKTNEKVAYIHLRDMTDRSLDKFYIEMNSYAVHKQALIVDLRFNNGGNIHNEVLEFLSQKSHFNWRFRNQKLNTHPNYTPGDRPIIVLINERSLSDAEVTSNGIKNLGIAKIVGTETYRWIIFTSSVGFADGSSIRMPAWGCYNLDGSDLEATGVKPDIYIKNTFEDRLLNKDPQLDKAIEEILKSL